MDTPAEAPTPHALRRAGVYWEQARDDQAEAKRRLREGDWLGSGFLAYQAAVNALTCVCLLNGTARPPNHSAALLAEACQAAHPLFADLAEACGELDAAQHRNPYAEQRDEAEEKRFARDSTARCQAVLKVVGKYLKANRRRFRLD